MLRIVAGPVSLACAALSPSVAEGGGDPEVALVPSPPREGTNPAYVGHRAPLEPEPLLKLPVGSVRARGWLDEQLRLMADGMFGHMDELSQWCRPEGSAWRTKDGKGERGWEELPYWLKGFTSLARLRDDRKLVALANEWIEATLASQQPDGWFGPIENEKQPDLWPNMVMLWALRTHFEATGDARVLALLTKYHRWMNALPIERLLPESWQKVRGGDDLDVVHWLYDRTGEPWLLELARKIHERTADWTSGIADFHGVNFCQSFREPAQFFAQSRDPRHLAATVRDYAEMMHRFGQVPGGMFGADEVAREGHGDPRQAAEACSMVEFMLSFEMLCAATGDTTWADRCEEVAFNSLPAAATPDWKALHYLTPANVIALDAEDHSPGFVNGGCMLAYSPHEQYRCCQHNVVQGWPYFTERCWMATRDRGLAAVLFAPCAVSATVGDGVPVQIEERTIYPFDERVEFDLRAGKPSRFSLYVRVPGWCEHPHLALNHAELAIDRSASGSWLRIEREWNDGDSLELALPMQVRVRRFTENHGAVAVDRGPLTWSLDMGEGWRVSGGTKKWPEWEVEPTRPWNYALVLDEKEPARSFEFVSLVAGAEGGEWATFPKQPFTHELPLHLKARGRRIPQWKSADGLIGLLQDSPVRSDAPIEELRLLPMGCARLRLSMFPVIGDGPGAHVWREPPKPATASHRHDEITALNDGVLPKDSGDPSVPRFTFWDHKGTVEWVQYDFEKPRRLARSGVYWFDDTGRGECRVPKSWRLLWKDGEQWREVAHASSFGVARDRMNETTFDAVTTSALRLEVTLQPGFSGGMFEWTAGE